MTDIYTIRHLEQDQLTDADQVELAAIINGSAILDAGQFDERVAGVLDDEAEELMDDDPRWSRQDRILEDEVGPVASEIDRRIRLLGETYPFRRNGNEVIYAANGSGFYEYFLAISRSPTLTKKPYTSLPRTFERISADLVRSYMGVHTEAFHTGWPRNPENGRTFVQAMNALHIAAGERDWFWSPQRGYPVEPSRGGDEGLDFVVWKRSLDGRVGEIVIVGQCACGNDWDTKFGDLTIDRLQPWFRPTTHVPATRCFATPFVLSDGNFLTAHQRAGWVLDRIRLVRMAEAAAGDQEISKWSGLIGDLTLLVAKAA